MDELMKSFSLLNEREKIDFIRQIMSSDSSGRLCMNMFFISCDAIGNNISDKDDNVVFIDDIIQREVTHMGEFKQRLNRIVNYIKKKDLQSVNNGPSPTDSSIIRRSPVFSTTSTQQPVEPVDSATATKPLIKIKPFVIATASSSTAAQQPVKPVDSATASSSTATQPPDPPVKTVEHDDEKHKRWFDDMMTNLKIAQKKYSFFS